MTGNIRCKICNRVIARRVVGASVTTSEKRWDDPYGSYRVNWKFSYRFVCVNCNMVPCYVLGCTSQASTVTKRNFTIQGLHCSFSTVVPADICLCKYHYALIKHQMRRKIFLLKPKEKLEKKTEFARVVFEHPEDEAKATEKILCTPGAILNGGANETSVLRQLIYDKLAKADFLDVCAQTMLGAIQMLDETHQTVNRKTLRNLLVPTGNEKALNLSKEWPDMLYSLFEPGYVLPIRGLDFKLFTTRKLKVTDLAAAKNHLSAWLDDFLNRRFYREELRDESL
jgi:hypothetical protein